ncbi:MAG: glycosyltransferase, partial [Halioglobus sp.]
MKKKKARKPNILFVHMVCPAQFSDLCEYLNDNELANGYYLTTPGNRDKNLSKYKNLLPLTPDGNIVGQNSYYFSGKAERAGRVSIALHRHLQELLKRLRIDLIVAHGTMGAPHFLFEEFDIPIITYIEFPSYQDHGWDRQFPPTEGQRLTDKNMQMLSYYEVLKSDVTIVPTQYARSLFPEIMQDRIVARFEGILPERIHQREPSEYTFDAEQKTVGFAARDLSSAKGLASFIATADYMIKNQTSVHFVIIGDANASTYSYERIFLDRKYGKEKAVTYLDHLLRKHKLDPNLFTITGKLPYKQYSDLLHSIDLFVYPVLHGSGNWGMMELLARGRPVIASNRCYVSEMIEHNDNGVIVYEDKPEIWAKEINALLADDERRLAMGKRAAERGAEFHMPHVAEQYMQLFTETMA